MELGCNTYSLKSCRRTIAFAHARALGFDAIELWAGHVRGAEDDPEGIAAEARAAGLALRVFCIGGLFGLAPSDVERRLEHCLPFAKRLGTDLVSGIVDRAALPLVDRACTAHGVRFAVENHWYTEMARPADFADLDACSERVGVNVDTGHFAFLGCDLAEIARRLGPRTFNVHLKTVRVPGRAARWWQRMQRDHRMTPALPGPRDGLDGFVSALRDTGYDGLLSVEHESDQLRLTELRDCLARARELAAAQPQTEAA